jgi:transcriptional regulator with XRE-family HTH domain
MPPRHNPQVRHLTQSGLDQTRRRARLLLHGVTVRDVAAQSGEEEALVSKVLSGRRSATSKGGQRIVAAAEALSGLTWLELSAPITRRSAA